MRIIGNSSSLETLRSRNEALGPTQTRPADLRDDDVFDVGSRPNRNPAPAAKTATPDEDAVGRMILSKGEKWNDAETRRALLRAGLEARLVDAMNKVPAKEQEAARDALAKDAIAFFRENDGLRADLDNPFLQERITLFWTLFGERDKALYETGVKGVLDLDVSPECEAEIRSALTIVESFAVLKKMDALCQLE